MSKRRKKLYGICVAAAVVIAVIIGSFLFVPYEETSEGNPKLVQSENMKTLKDALQTYASKGNNVMTVEDMAPFSWDTLQCKDGKFVFYQGKKNVCEIGQQDPDVNLVFNYQEHEQETLKKSAKTSCHLNVERGRIRVRIFNEKSTELKKADLTAMKGAYGYDITSVGNNAVDTSGSQIQYYKEDSNKIGVFQPWQTFYLNEDGAPTIYTRADDNTTSTWNEKGNYWVTKENKAIQAVTKQCSNIGDVRFFAKKKRYTATTGNTAVIFDEDGDIHHELSIMDLAEYYSFSRGLFSIGSVIWLHDNQYIIEVYQGDSSSRFIRSLEDGKRFRRTYVVYDFTMNSPIETPSFLKDTDYQMVGAGENMIYMLTNEQNLVLLDDRSLQPFNTISLVGVKMAASDFQGQIDTDKWMNWEDLFGVYIWNGKIYLITKAGLYYRDINADKWKLLMDGVNLPSLGNDDEKIWDFKMVSEDEFYVLTMQAKAGKAGHFYHYKKVHEKPITKATDEFEIMNSALVSYRGANGKSGKINIPDEVTRLVRGAFATKDKEQNRNILLRLTSHYALDPDVFQDCPTMTILSSDNKRTLHAYYFSSIVTNTVEVVVPSRLRKFDAEGMMSNVTWHFQGKTPPKVINRDKPVALNFNRMIVPAGTKEDYVKAFDLDSGLAMLVEEEKD